MKTIKWGILGTGNIASQFAIALITMENTKLAAVASRDLGRAENFAARFQVEKAYDSYEALAKDPEIDVVYIATPHTEHKSNAALCIMNGKAVLCEKPFTLNQKDTQYLISLAREYNVFLMEAMWMKFLPAINRIKEWVQAGIIGEVKCFQVSFGFRKEFDATHRLYDPALGGGALLDLGIYPITFVVHMMDRLPDRVNSFAHLGKTKVDEMNVITFQYNKGVLAELTSGIVMNTSNEAVILGEKGKIVVPGFWGAGKAFAYDAEGNLLETIDEKYNPNGYIFEAAEVNRCLREGAKESSIVPLQDTLDIMKLMDDVRASWGLIYPQE